MAKIYSAMDCGCYHEGDDAWILCERHTSWSTDTATQSTEKAKYLYALKLKDGMYYIGMTARQNPYDRINQHYNMTGARWTILYEPVEVLEIIPLGNVTIKEAENAENDLTLLYMEKYGTQNVRGGRMTRVKFLFFKQYNPFTWRWVISNGLRAASYLIITIAILMLVLPELWIAR